MTSALVFQVAALLTRGATLATLTHDVGPVTRHPRFACLDRSGGLVEAPEVHDETTSDGREHDRRGNGAVWVPRTRHDFSAFGAARAFVGACSERDVKRAIEKARDR